MRQVALSALVLGVAVLARAQDAWDAPALTPKEVRSARLTLFLSLDAPEADRALRAGRAFERTHPEVVFDPVLLVDLDRLSSVGKDPELVRRMQALSASGEGFAMVGTVPAARRFGIAEVPAFVLEVGGRAHRITGVPDLEDFYRRCIR
ncbi:MAG: hypothetical protein HY722_04840 [Planctomycetes bacterium]|nr:hypothetical protein [Planctomycetota bacterium]